MGSDALFALAVVLAVSSTVVDGQDGSFTIKTGRGYSEANGRIGGGDARYSYSRTDVFDVKNDGCVCTDTGTLTGLAYRYFVVKTGVQQNGDFWSVTYDNHDCNIFFYPSACNTDLRIENALATYGPGQIPQGEGEGITGVTHIQLEQDGVVIDGFKSYEVCCFGVEPVPQQGPAPYL